MKPKETKNPRQIPRTRKKKDTSSKFLKISIGNLPYKSSKIWTDFYFHFIFTKTLGNWHPRVSRVSLLPSLDPRRVFFSLRSSRVVHSSKPSSTIGWKKLYEAVSVPEVKLEEVFWRLWKELGYSLPQDTDRYN
jgi:hypothetical protein